MVLLTHPVPRKGTLIAVLVIALVIGFVVRGKAETTPVASNSVMLSEDARAYLLNPTHMIIRANGVDHRFTIELADTEEKRAKGLMFRTAMDDRHGMLFDFGRTDQVYMWMKNTFLSLDMIFVKHDGIIHHIVRGTTPLSESIIGSAGPVRYILEVKSGTADKIGAKPGDRLLHQLFTPLKPQ